ncbi:MAG: hypothetical protein Fur0037_25090 [Planctomycetota bacterium]
MRRRILLGLLCILEGCAAEPAPDRKVSERPRAKARVELALGVRIRLRRAADLSRKGPDAEWANILWREAIGQSSKFDFVPPGDRLDDEPPLALELLRDASAGVLTATLHAEGSPPLVLGAVPATDLLSAVDRLAWQVRIALGDDEAPVPVGECVSRSRAAAIGAERARRLLAQGDFEGARREAEKARGEDGGSPFVLDVLSAACLLAGDAERAASIAEEALTFRGRLSPPVEHRLARTLLLGRSLARAGQRAAFRLELLRLSEVALRERPHDPQVLFTRALALNLSDRFSEALPLLHRLSDRLRDHALVAYHLGWAELGTGDARGALLAFRKAAPKLPRESLVVPMAISYFEAGEHEALDRWLLELLDEARTTGGSAAHAILRMLASHAILTGRLDLAGDRLLEDLAWLCQRPSILETRAGDLAEEGQVLVLLGRAGDLGRSLSAVSNLRPSGVLADVLSFLTGLQQVAGTGNRAEAIEERLARTGGMDVWSNLLKAMGHRARGEVLDEYSALVQASRLSDSPLVKAALVRSLRLTGRRTEALTLRSAIRRELRAIHLAEVIRHPILAPDLAHAYLAE